MDREVEKREPEKAKGVNEERIGTERKCLEEKKLIEVRDVYLL